jgi:hypothetical protein
VWQRLFVFFVVKTPVPRPAARHDSDDSRPTNDSPRPYVRFCPTSDSRFYDHFLRIVEPHPGPKRAPAAHVVNARTFEICHGKRRGGVSAVIV